MPRLLFTLLGLLLVNYAFAQKTLSERLKFDGKLSSVFKDKNGDFEEILADRWSDDSLHTVIIDSAAGIIVINDFPPLVLHLEPLPENYKSRTGFQTITKWKVIEVNHNLASIINPINNVRLSRSTKLHDGYEYTLYIDMEQIVAVYTGWVK